MGLSKAAALEVASDLMSGARVEESHRLNRISEAMRPLRPGEAPHVEIPRDAPPLMKALAHKAETNYLPLIVDTFGQIMKADGYFSQGSPEQAGPWAHWQRNRMDARQTGLHRSALQYGAAYAVVLPGTYGRGEPGPVIDLYSPRQLTAVYADAAADEWPMYALLVQERRVRLFDEDVVHEFGYVTPDPYLRGALVPSFSRLVNGGRLTYLESRAHDVGVCPVVRYRDRMLLDGEEQFGIVEPLMTLQERIHETTFGMLVAQFFSAFKQRYVIGWVPESEQEALKASAATLWTFADLPDQVKVGELNETDLTRYIESKKSAIHDLAAIGQLPAQALGVDGISNISAEALAGLEQAKDRKADEITTSLGESHEQMLRLCAYVEGDDVAAEDFSSEIRWKDASARSFAQTVDGLGKLATMLGIPAELLWEDVPGWTDTKVQRAKDLRRRDSARSAMASLVAVADGDPLAG